VSCASFICSLISAKGSFSGTETGIGRGEEENNEVEGRDEENNEVEGCDEENNEVEGCGEASLNWKGRGGRLA